MYKAVKITQGAGGWGGPLIIEPTEKRNKIVSITGGGIDAVTKRIAELTGAEAVDGFSTGIPDDEYAVAVVDCGGTARCGVYPKKGIYTVNLMPVGQSGPLAAFIKPDIYVSGVKPDDVQLADASEAEAAAQMQPAKTDTSKEELQYKADAPGSDEKQSFIVRLGKSVGGVVGKLFQAGRDTIDMVIRNILPFMAFVAMIIGIINGTGLGGWIAQTISPMANNIWGLLIVSSVQFLLSHHLSGQEL
jgi:PTS system glucitol/sorbitol-specific IIB component